MYYRRDISSTLTILTTLLVLFVGYQLWVKPAPQPPALPESASTGADGPESPASHELSAHSLADVPPSRLVELGEAPSPALGAIREELEKANYTDVEQRLKALSKKIITQAADRHYVAGLWNNLGIQQEKAGGTAKSVKAFKQAVVWDPASPQAHLNLTQAYWELRDPAMTTRFLETVIRLAPDDPFPHLALADLLLTAGNGTQAATHLDLARARAERDAGQRAYWKKLSAKVEALGTAKPLTHLAVEHAESKPPTATPVALPSSKNPATTPSKSVQGESKTEQTSSSEATTPSARLPQTPQLTTHFTVQYDGAPDDGTWTRIRAMLDFAYDEVSQKFGHTPNKPLSVVLHTHQKFSESADSPIWADTLFDPTSGAIHLPTQGALDDLARLSRVVRHELVHAMLFEYTRGVKTPLWITEGLAIHLAEDVWPALEQTGTTHAFIPLSTLQGEWTSLSEEVKQAAYIEARSATQHLLDHYSMYGVRQVMYSVATGHSLNAAMQQKLSVSFDQFQRQWEQTYPGPTTSGTS